MARLNEPPAPTESLDSLKRRFIRQNRDFARANSIQAIRIRSLENEISQLVAENCVLREQVLSLHNQLERSQGNGNAFSQINLIRDQLEQKLRDVQDLVGELRGVGSRRRRKRNTLDTTALLQIDRKSKVASMEPEGLLSPIIEGKYYPRKTLENVDFQVIADANSDDSPDIGPPPKTFFDREPNGGSSEFKEEDDISGLLSTRLDTRRRRKSSQLRPFSDLEASEQTRQSEITLDGNQPVRASMKRKLNHDSDAAARGTVPATASADSQTLSGIATVDSIVKRAPLKPLKTHDDLTLTTSPARKILAPKAINTDPVVSPKKIPAAVDNGKNLQSRSKSKEEGQQRDRSKARASRLQRLSVDLQKSSEPRVEVVEIDSDVLIKAEPVTPGLIDVFSPQSSKPSEARVGGRATPPPGELKRSRDAGAAVADNNVSAVGRSRRSRPNVSYAEPNLISKMRRPGKELADAVTKDQRRSTSTEPPQEFPDTSLLPGQIKQELDSKPDDHKLVRSDGAASGPTWKPSLRDLGQDLSKAQPASPLKEKGSLSNQGGSMVSATDHEALRSLSIAEQTQTSDSKSGASRAASALSNGVKPRRIALETSRDLDGALQSLCLTDRDGLASRTSIVQQSKSATETRPRLNRRQTVSDATIGSSSRSRSALPVREAERSGNLAILDENQGREAAGTASRRRSMVL